MGLMHDNRWAAALAVVSLTTAWLSTGSAVAQEAEALSNEPTRSFYLVSLDQAPLPEAAEAVLVQSLRSAMAIDPGLTATVTFRVSEPLSERELEERFASTLAEQNVALVRVEGGYRLMDLTGAFEVRPRLDIVTVEPPPMKTGAIPASGVPVVVKSKAVATPRKTIRPLLTFAALFAIMAAFGLAWLKRKDIQRLGVGMKAVRSRRSPRLKSARDRVVDRLLSERSVDLAVLAAACDQAARTNRPVEQMLCALGAVDEDQLADAYAAVTGLERWTPSADVVVEDADMTSLQAYIRGRPLKLVDRDDWSVSVATVDPLDDQTFAALSRLSGRMVTFRIARWSDVSVEGTASTSERHSGLVSVPWFKSRPDDGAALLQAILSRRLAIQPEV